MSLASIWVMDVLQGVFPKLYGGHYNCKNIGGGSTPSQHSWPNARDLTSTDYGYSDDPGNQEYLDEVAAFIMLNWDALSVKTMLWRGKSWGTGNPVGGHQDHIHLDFWPTGHSLPPCRGGRLRYRYPDNRTVYGDPGPMNGMTETNDPRPTPPPEAEGDYEMPTLELWAGYNSHNKGDQRNTTRMMQSGLAGAGYADARTSDKTCAADGWFGQGTDAAVRSFQRAHGLVVDGICGRLTWAALVAS